MSALTSMLLLATGLLFGDSVGIYAPAVLPGTNLTRGVWGKESPAPFGPKTTARIQALYDAMCERVDLFDPDYQYADDKTALSFDGCPSPATRAAISGSGSVLPSAEQCRQLYSAMVDWVYRDPYVCGQGTDSYQCPSYLSPLCHDIALSVSSSGLSTQDPDIYPWSLTRFGDVGYCVGYTSNALAAVASALGTSYSVRTGGTDVAKLDADLCLFTPYGDSLPLYADVLLTNTVNGLTPLYWGPFCAFDRICSRLASRNVAVVNTSEVGYPITSTLVSYTYSFNYDLDELRAQILSHRNKSWPDNVFAISPVSVSVGISSPVSSTTYNAWSSASATPIVQPCKGSIDRNGVHFSDAPCVQVVVNVVGSSVDPSFKEPICGPLSLVAAPQYLNKSKVTAVGKVTSSSSSGVGGSLTGTSLYTTTAVSYSPFLGDLFRTATSNTFVVSEADVRSVLTEVTNTVNGIMSVAVGDFDFEGSAVGETGDYSARILKRYDLPYLICENQYNLTHWSKSTEAVDVGEIGTQNGYSGTGTFDAWVSSSAAPGGDGSAASPFRSIDDAIAAVSPVGGPRSVQGRVPRIAVGDGVYTNPVFFAVYPAYVMTNMPPYDVCLVGTSTNVTVVMTSMLTGRFTRTGPDTVTLGTTFENLNVHIDKRGGNSEFYLTNLKMKNCRITGGATYITALFVNTEFDRCLFDDFYALSQFTYYLYRDDDPDRNEVAPYVLNAPLFDNCNILNSIVKLKKPKWHEDNNSPVRYPLLTKRTEVVNSVIHASEVLVLQGGRGISVQRLSPVVDFRSFSDTLETMRIGTRPYGTCFLDSTVYVRNLRYPNTLFDELSEESYPLTASRCLFFADRQQNTPPSSVDNIMLSSTNFTDRIDPVTYAPRAGHEDLLGYGFNNTRREE